METGCSKVYFLLGGALGNFLKQSKELGLGSKIIGHNEAEDPTVLDVAEDSAEGFYASSLDPKQKNENTDLFEKNYVSMFKEPSNVLARNAYDAFNLIIKGYDRCNNDNLCIKNFILNVKDYAGTSGTISVDSNGIASKPTTMKQAVGGKFVEVQN